MWKNKKKFFENLQGHYRDLSATSNSLINETSLKLELLSKNIDSIGLHIDTARINIDLAMEQVKRSENKKWWWGLGGLAVGFIFASVILALN